MNTANLLRRFQWVNNDGTAHIIDHLKGRYVKTGSVTVEINEGRSRCAQKHHGQLLTIIRNPNKLAAIWLCHRCVAAVAPDHPGADRNRTIGDGHDNGVEEAKAEVLAIIDNGSEDAEQIEALAEWASE